MENFIKVTLQGRAGNIEARSINGMNGYRISVCVEKVVRDRGGNAAVSCDWWNVIYWAKKELQVNVGDTVAIEGCLRQRRYINAEGRESFYTEIVAKEVRVL